MTTRFPTAAKTDQVEQVRRRLEGRRFAEAGHVYAVDAAGRLLGQVSIEALLAAEPTARIGDILGPPPVEVHPDDDAERAALVAVSRHDSDVAVTDADGHLVGVVATPALLALLHDEHVEDFLRVAGMTATHPPPHGPYRVWPAYQSRLRWLLLGLAGGIGAAFVVKAFDAAIEAQIVLVAFMPLVVYLAGAVGTQTEAIVVRSMAVGQQRFAAQFAQESWLGILLGVSLGSVALGAVVALGFPVLVALVVGVSIVAATVLATILATCVCWGAACLGADPALASGPVATVIQDVVSVAVYLGVATALL